MGSLNKSGPKIKLLGFSFKVSYLVWLVEHGSWPQEEDLGHISNLREATRPVARVFRSYDPQQALRELLSFSFYDRERGGFVRTARRNGPYQNQKIGELVGSLTNDGYLLVRLLGRQFNISHLVWLVEYGSWPQEDLDHRDQVRSNNHISNLREAAIPINQKNTRMQSNNTTGYTGVTFHKDAGKYAAEVEANRKRHYCGLHSTPEGAYAARQVLIAAHPEWGFTELHGL